MENNLENKAKFFAQYWGQKIAFFQLGMEVGDFTIKFDSQFQELLNKSEYGLEKAFLKLTPLSQITDEDAKFLGYPDVKSATTTYANLLGHFAKDSDYLRSKGYALPWMGLSVEQQIEFGWIKLK